VVPDTDVVEQVHVSLRKTAVLAILFFISGATIYSMGGYALELSLFRKAMLFMVAVALEYVILQIPSTLEKKLLIPATIAFAIAQGIVLTALGSILGLLALNILTFGLILAGMYSLILVVIGRIRTRTVSETSNILPGLITVPVLYGIYVMDSASTAAIILLTTGLLFTFIKRQSTLEQAGTSAFTAALETYQDFMQRPYRYLRARINIK
jgi:hypothetical protein